MTTKIIRDLYKIAIEIVQVLHEKSKTNIFEEFQRRKEVYPQYIFPDIDIKNKHQSVNIYTITLRKSCSINLIYNTTEDEVTGAFITLEDANHKNDFIKVIEEQYSRYYSEWAEGRTWRNEKHIILEETQKDKWQYTILFKSSLQEGMKEMACKL